MFNQWIFLALLRVHLVYGGFDIEVELTNNITNGYNKNIRPSDTVNINLTIFINQITSIDDSNQQMKSSLNIMAIWKDPRLSWNQAEFNTSYALVKADSLWMPDLVILNSASANIFLNLDSKSMAFVEDDGEVAVLYSVPALATRCSMDVTKFPMDRQSCSINISSWSMCDDFINITLEAKVMDFYTENTVWSLDLDGISGFSQKGYDRFSYQHKDCLMDVASLTLPLTRRPLYYMINMIFPSFILSIITIACFALPSAAQFSITLTIFLNYSIISVRISSQMPVQSTSMPMVTWYFVGSMMITLLSFLWFVLDFILRSSSYLPSFVAYTCVWVRSLTKSLHFSRKKKLNVIENGNKTENQAESEKKPECEQSKCDKCNKTEQESKSSDNKKAEFESNMIFLNRIVFFTIFIATLIFNIACWTFIGSG